MPHFLPRRDRLRITGRRMRMLQSWQAQLAFAEIARRFEDELSMKDVPKFEDVLGVIVEATHNHRKKK